MKKTINVMTANQRIIALGEKDMSITGMTWFTSIIPISEILTDMGYQRETDEARVRKLDKEYNSDKVDVKCVNYRPEEDKFACMDGLHTLTLLKSRGITHMNCKVFVGKSYEEEAIFFAAQNKGIKKITTVQEFKALLEAQDNDTVTIYNIMKRWGCELSQIAGVNKIRSIRKLTKIYSENGASGLDFYFELIHDAGWGDDPKAYTEAGMNVGFYAYPECTKPNGTRAKTRYNELVKVLRKYKTSTQYTDTAAHLFSETVTRHPQDAVKKLIQQDLYVINQRLKKYQDTQKDKRSKLIEKIK